MVKPSSRIEFERSAFSEEQVLDNPFDQFVVWWQEAEAAQVYMIDAIHLATVDKDNRPDLRVVLLKDFDQRGLVFFTNYESKKAEEISSHPYGAMNIFWLELERQIRLRGKIEKTTPQESNLYFQSRPRGAQIGAWTSPQSKPVKDRSVLEKIYAEREQEFSGREIPCPTNWGGYRLIPDYFEFWQGRTNRLHDRFAFSRRGTDWLRERLAP